MEDPFTAFHWHGDVFELPDGAVQLAASTQTEQQAFRYGDNAYGLLFHLDVTPKTVAGMTTAFQGAYCVTTRVARVCAEGSVMTVDAALHTHLSFRTEFGGTLQGGVGVDDTTGARELAEGNLF